MSSHFRLKRFFSRGTRRRLLDEILATWGTRADAVLAELDSYSGSGLPVDPDEVRFAVVTLCEGSFENMKRWLIVAKEDYRDVLGPVQAPDRFPTDHARRFNERKLDAAAIRETSFEGLLVEGLERK